MTRVRRRSAVGARAPERHPDTKVYWHIQSEAARARLARRLDKANQEHPAHVIWVDPATRRPDDWWLSTPGIDPDVRFRELHDRGLVRFDPLVLARCQDESRDIRESIRTSGRVPASTFRAPDV